MIWQHFYVPWPPSENHCHVTTKTGRRVLTAKAKAYQDEVAALVAQTAAPLPPKGLIVVEAFYNPPNNARRDTINHIKVLADGLKVGLGVDDCRFLWREMARHTDRVFPGVALVVYPLEEEE